MAWLSNSLDVHQHPWPDPTPQGIIYLDDSFTFQERKTKERTNTTKTEKNLTNTLHITKSWNSHVTREAVTWKNWSKQNKNQASNLYWKNWSKQKKNQAKNRYYKTENLTKTLQITKRTALWNSHVTRQSITWKTDQNRRKTKERTNTTKQRWTWQTHYISLKLGTVTWQENVSLENNLSKQKKNQGKNQYYKTEKNLTKTLHIAKGTRFWNSHVTRECVTWKTD